MNKIKHFIKRNLFNIYARFKHPFPVWKFLNRKRMSLFKANRPSLSDVQKRILTDLNDTGIATATIDELFPGEEKFQELLDFVDKRRPHAKINHKKKYLKNYWDECVELEVDNPFVRLALDPKVLDTANSYMEMFTTLMDVNLQETIPTPTERTHSQNWHRDPQEKKICKVFLYLNDVDINTGPFVYIKNSKPGSKYGHLFPQEIPAGSYPEQEALGKEVSKEEIVPMTAKAGTIIFCDTIGFHYGGLSKEKPRLMLTLVYGARTYRENQMYYYGEGFKRKLKEMRPAAQCAIRKEWQDKK